jgi:hypothetical protein
MQAGVKHHFMNNRKPGHIVFNIALKKYTFFGVRLKAPQNTLRWTIDLAFLQFRARLEATGISDVILYALPRFFFFLN